MAGYPYGGAETGGSAGGGGAIKTSSSLFTVANKSSASFLASSMLVWRSLLAAGISKSTTQGHDILQQDMQRLKLVLPLSNFNVSGSLASQMRLYARLVLNVAQKRPLLDVSDRANRLTCGPRIFARKLNEPGTAVASKGAMTFAKS